MIDIIERVEADEASWHPAVGYPSGLVAELVAALKAERAKHARLQKDVTRLTDLCICDKAGLGHYDGVSCKVHPDE